MIDSLEIPRDRWGPFLARFYERFHERPMRVEIEALEIGNQEQGRHLPLRAIQLETKGAQAGDLLIELGQDEGPVSHTVVGPTRICVGYNAGGLLEWLAIEDRAQGKTVLYAEHPLALPGEVEPPGAQP